MKTWWEQPEDLVHDVLWPLCKLIEDESSQSLRFDRSLRNYGGSKETGGQSRSIERAISIAFQTNTVKLNIIESIVDTIHSKITKNSPKPMYLTLDGDVILQKRAKRRGEVITSLFLEKGAYESGSMACFDAILFGTGFVQVGKDGPDLFIERVFPSEILVDPIESMYAPPRSLFRKKKIMKEVLLNHFPEKESNIESSWNSNSYAPNITSNLVDVVEAWHIPSGKDAEDGRHSICVEGSTLLDEQWDYEWFPFCQISWKKPVIGFWSRGVSDQIEGIQKEITDILGRIQEILKNMATPRIFIEHGSNIVVGHVTNQIGGIIKYTGSPPIFHPGVACPPEVFNQLDRLYQRAYEIVGVSQMSAQSKKPAGVDSGIALRTLDDKETERFVSFGKEYENFYLDMAKRVSAFCNEIAEEYGDFPIKTHKNEGIESIKWSEIDMEEDQYKVSVFPTSLLPTTPAGRLQTVTELINMGYIPREIGLKLIDYPDIQEYTRLETAQIDDIDLTLNEILEGKDPVPESFQNLNLGVSRMLSYYLKLRHTNLPEDRKNAIRDWIEIAQAELIKQQTPQPVEQPIPPQPTDQTLLEQTLAQ